MRNRSFHLLAYTDSVGIGGAEISLGHLVRTADPDLQITVVGVAQKVVQFVAQQRPRSQSIVLPDKGIQAVFAHFRCFWKQQPEVVHLNLCTPWAGAIAQLVALSLPQARVIRVDQLPLRTTEALTLWRTRALCLRTDAHVAVGQASARRMEDFYALGRNSVLSIPNGVPDYKTPSLDAPRPQGEIVVGTIARLNPMKAQDILLEAIARVEATRLVILGDGDTRAELQQLAQKLGIAHRVEFRGWVDHPQRYLSEFDIVAIPSRSEGFPLSMVEAMLAARPIVATRVGSMPEAIFDGKTGLLVKKNDVSELANALQRLRDDRTLRQQLGQHARELALAHFTSEAMTQQYEQLWEKVLSLPRRPRLWVPRPLD